MKYKINYYLISVEENNLTMNRLIIILSLVFWAQMSFLQDVTFTLTNPRIESESGNDYFLADVLSYSNSGFKLGSGQLYFNYDTSAFGPNMHSNNNLEMIIPDSSVLNAKVGVPPDENDFYNDFVTNDNRYSKFSFSWQHAYSFSCLDTNNIHVYSDLIFTIKLKFKAGQSGTDPGVCIESGNNYVNQTFTPCGPVSCDVKDCYNHPGTQIVNDLYPCDDCTIVYSNADSGPGSLREAIACANAGDTIRFARNLRADSIFITSDFYSINESISILADKDFGIVVSGNAVDRVFDVLSGNDVVLEGLHLIQGSGVDGSIIKNAGNLSIVNLSMYMSTSGTQNSHILNLGTMSIDGDNVLIQD